MTKFIVTLEITVEAEDRESALDNATSLTYSLPDVLLYDAVEKTDE